MAETNTLRVVSLNLAHGRKDYWHQTFLRKSTIRANLDEVARILTQESPDVVALQEADGPSLWSGRFHHVEYLAERTGIPFYVLGDHVRRLKLSYGTALVSRHPLENTISHRFAPSPPTLSKGMVLGTIRWPGVSSLECDVASVHLDFSRKSVRGRQAAELIERLAGNQRPLILMGDFNCGFDGKDRTLMELAKELRLSAHEPLAADMISFPNNGRRLDWIMISREFEFVDYRTLPDVLSDHRAVVATVRLAR